MKFIIYVGGRIRNGQRVGLPEFPYSEKHEKYVYQNRELTTEEFNAIAPVIFNVNYRSNGFPFCPLAIEEEPTAKVDVPAAPVVRPAAPTGEPPAFTLDDKAILLNGERVAGLYGDDKQLRVVSAHADLRPAIEEWLATQG